MSEINKIIILGSGTSTGVPTSANHWGVCDPLNKKNYRLRTSILLETKHGQNILVDTTPDLRQQCLSNAINKIDSVIITHNHADHLHGLDDVRPFCYGPPTKHIPLYTSSDGAQEIRQRFPYIFNPKQVSLGGGIPLIDLRSISLLDHSITSFIISELTF